MWWTAHLQPHRNVPIYNADGPPTSHILAFSEGLELAINGHELAFRLRPVYHPKADIPHKKTAVPKNRRFLYLTVLTHPNSQGVRSRASTTLS